MHASFAPDTRHVPVWIYALVSPTTGLVRYVGKSVEPRVRLAGHIARPCSRPLAEWLELLKKERDEMKRRPLLVLLEEIPPGGDIARAEARWIRHFWIHGRIENVCLPDLMPHRPGTWSTKGCATDGQWMLANYANRVPFAGQILAIARACSTSIGTVCNWLTGRSRPSLKQRETVYQETGVLPRSWETDEEMFPSLAAERRSSTEAA